MLQTLPDREIGVQAGSVEDADYLARCLIQVGRVFIQNRDVATVIELQAQNAFKRGGFARAIEADQTVNRALPDFKIKVFDDLKVSIALSQFGN